MCTYKRNNWTTKATLTTSSHQEARFTKQQHPSNLTPQPYWWQHARTTNKHFQPHTWIHKLPGNTKITEGTSKILNRFTIEENGLQEQSWPPQANRKQGSPNSNNSSQTTTSLVTTWTTNKHFQPQTWIQKPPWNTRITERTSKIVDRFTIGRN